MWKMKAKVVSLVAVIPRLEKVIPTPTDSRNISEISVQNLDQISVSKIAVRTTKMLHSRGIHMQWLEDLT